MAKPTIFLDANVLSTLHYRGGDVRNLARRMKTEEWWEKESSFFLICSSSLVEEELANGTYAWQHLALRTVRKLRFISPSKSAREIGSELLQEAIFPINQRGDAMHLADCIANRLDWLMTWNYAHLVNPHVLMRVVALAERRHWRIPLVMSPDQIPWKCMGRDIRRRD